jgi:hypothetical protein
MGLAICPNYSHPLYKYAEEKLGANKALEIYDAIGTVVIPKPMTDAFVKQRDATNPILVPHDSKRKAYVDGNDNNGLPFSNFNNDRSWDVETKTGLRYDFETKNGKRVPKYEYFGMKGAVKRINELREEYPGFIFTPKEVRVGNRTTLRVIVNDLTFPVWAKNKPEIKEISPIRKYDKLTNYEDIPGLKEKEEYVAKDMDWDNLRGKSFYSPYENIYIDASNFEEFLKKRWVEYDRATSGGTHYYFEWLVDVANRGEALSFGVKFT